MSKENYQIRPMNKEEVELAVNWAADEGWNPGINDAHSYYLADPTGFLIGLLDDEPVAVISAIKYNKEFGFIGFYIVKPQFRGKGYGFALWQAAMTYLNGCNVGLDGVVDQQSNYRKSGFELAYRNVRYEGAFSSALEMEDTQPSTLVSAAFNLQQIQDYEQPFFPAQRNRFNEQWRTQSNAHALAISTEDKIQGYGVIRACKSGYKIGPLYADTVQYAKSLVVSLIAKVATHDEVASLLRCT
ncbi:GNAT family N-acetyltransferase [Pseudoalteromonas luteoviolacea]|uniref:GNAT family N-acetyltransferase n=1 Tax=Pseudoalteromonas luteoviolacea TaxID=43657 RepID=UPI000B1820AA|nr:GNAT family N-acetyltransferase [Pseudoalteromonas luteoviolacea]